MIFWRPLVLLLCAITAIVTTTGLGLAVIGVVGLVVAAEAAYVEGTHLRRHPRG